METRGEAETKASIHKFEQITDDRFSLTIPDSAIAFEIDRLRREHNELLGELCVRCSLPGVPTYDGALSIADFNLSSARARAERANLLSKRSESKELDWAGYLEEFCQRVLAAERMGQPAIDLRALERPALDDSLRVEGYAFPEGIPPSSLVMGERRNPTRGFIWLAALSVRACRCVIRLGTCGRRSPGQARAAFRPDHAKDPLCPLRTSACLRGRQAQANCP